MKTNFALLSFLFISQFSFSQNNSFSFVESKVQNISPSCNGFEEYKVHIVNMKSDSLLLAWTAYSNNLDSCWEFQYSVYDNYNCYLGIPASTNYFTKIGSGDTTYIKFGNSGMNTYSGNPVGRILIWDSDSLSNIDTITYNVTIDCGSQQCLSILGLLETGTSSNSFSIYPNPATEFLTLNLKSINANSFSILDITGREIISFPVTEQKINLNVRWLEQGNYFLVLKNKNSIISASRFFKL